MSPSRLYKTTPLLHIFLFCFCFILYETSIAWEIRSNNAGLLMERPEHFVQDTLHKAVRIGEIELVKTLLFEGVNPNLIDHRGWTALDYAKKRNRKEIRKILQESGAITFPKAIPDMEEGPHLRLLDSSTVEISFLKHDSINSKSTLQKDIYPLSQFPMEVNRILIDPQDLNFKSKPQQPRGIYTTASKIFAISDIHGEYDRILNF